MTQNTKLLINEAKEFLTKSPYDVAHGLEHHLQVLENTQLIAKNIKEYFDPDALHIAAMWHDVVINKKFLGKKIAKYRTAAYVSQRMKQLGFSHETIAKTKTAILQHSVMNTQTIIESKILADADLLEWFNQIRFKKFIKLYTTGKNKNIKKLALKIFAKKWLKKIPKLIHFKTTHKYLHQHLNIFQKNKTILQLFKEQGEQLDSYLKVFK